MNCPICEEDLMNEACPSCGYDRTIDREEFPTLCRIAGREPAKSARIANKLAESKTENKLSGAVLMADGHKQIINSDGSITEFDGSGKQIKTSHYYDDGLLACVDEYASNGKKYRSTVYRRDGGVMTMNEYNIQGERIRVHCYTEDGVLFSVNTYNAGGVIIKADLYKKENGKLFAVQYYDSNGKLTKDDLCNEDGTLYAVQYYDANGIKTKIDYYNRSGEIIHSHTFTKDNATASLSDKPKQFANAEVGSKISFGSYWQDKDKTKGKEAIDWRVLAKEDNKILVISDKALDSKPYNTSCTAVTWETCSLRKWMNGTFLNNAFSAEEQAQILSTTVSADKNPKHNISPGNATVDKVFLLSITEEEKYFSSDEDRKCVPTAYAIAQGADTGDCSWWLRSPGAEQIGAAYVRYTGELRYNGARVECEGCCVRPTLWINLDA